ncbi:hypothetical protein VOLCADRAFT_98060 [Volvox carteri f. nagariensis]|uniref:Uncharacterized protein n=1 Tax=Volvox carteri f. nagariensis TaxID=3068 RepID=D8UEC1_VOLCA|nr:uncharacterized protein VOLCADRAFT_98060 [Volvox carteri f. nagariensis]EFJ41977.1 hypothetical protein VOLCADRAFT_98060 [Volvox carteri f. nagariensis]|eukprot:XP_002957014.1 hypothetical protein VOLCADRAFT_98060 [Volvox carteri f. nagariensis]
MSTRRRSSRATNATNIIEQQKIDKALRRIAGSHGAEPRLEHGVLSEQKCAPVWNLFSRYAARSPRIQPRSDEAGPPMAAGGWPQRRRTPIPRPAVGEGGENVGDAAGVVDALAPAAAAVAAEAAEAAKSWDDDGHHVIDLLQPLLTRGVTAPRHLQEALMHMVLNVEAHSSSSLPHRAYSLLMAMLEWHPPAKLEGDVLMINEDLWAPVGCAWQAEPHRDKPRLQSLREATGLSALVASAHNWVVREAEGGGGGRMLPATGAPEGGDAGEVMLLKYWITMMQLDLDVRMGLMRLSGFRQRRTSPLESSLVYRLMLTYTNWADGSSSKPLLIRQLAAIRIWSHRAAVAVAGGGGGSGGGSQLVSLAEVGELAAALLGMMYDVYGALDRMRFYVRQGTQGRDNDLVRMDKVVSAAILKDLPYKDPENLRVLLGSLPPAACMRLLVYLLADAAYKRLEVGGDQLAIGLRRVALHYADNGVVGAPPQVRASDALLYLSSPGNWHWGAGAMSFGLPGRGGLTLLVAHLTISALQTAEQQVRQAREASAAAMAGVRQRRGDSGGGGGDDMEVDGVGGGGEAAAEEAAAEEVAAEALGEEEVVQMWAGEAREVARLFRQLAERLRSGGGGAGAGGSRGGGDGAVAAADCTATPIRCAELLVARVEAHVEADDMMGQGAGGHSAFESGY